jgi:hypothetical protein
VLTGRGGNALGAAWYASAIVALGVACLLVAPETVHRKLDHIP